MGNTQNRSIVIIVVITSIILISGCTGSQNITSNSTNSADFSELRQKVANLEYSLSDTKSELSTAKNQIIQLQSTVQKLQIQADSSTAYELLRKTLTDPKLLSAQITNQVMTSINVPGIFQSQVSGIISTFISSKLPTVNWVKNSISVSSGRTYVTSMKSIFPIEIETGIPLVGKITVARLTIIATGLVNVETEAVTNIQATIQIEK